MVTVTALAGLKPAAVHRRIVSAGFTSKKEPFDAFWGQRYAQVIDPDDNVVDLFAQLPTATS